MTSNMSMFTRGRDALLVQGVSVPSAVMIEAIMGWDSQNLTWHVGAQSNDSRVHS